jgi:hypothetical protein
LNSPAIDKPFERNWEKIIFLVVGIVLWSGALIIGGWLLWLWVIQAGLAWLDRLFYPYTPVIMLVAPLFVLALILVGSWATAKSPESDEP